MIYKKEILSKSITYWGEKAQLLMVIEECSELIKAIAKIDRKINGSTWDNIAEEYIDVKILLSSLNIILNNHNVSDLYLQTIENKKLCRLEEIFNDLENLTRR